MIAHNDARPGSLDIVAIDVEASGIVDLRDVSALEAVGIDLEDGLAPWQADADARGTPRSWTVGDRLIDICERFDRPVAEEPGPLAPGVVPVERGGRAGVRLLDTHRFCE